MPIPKDPQIVQLSTKRLVGMSMNMSRMHDRTGALWTAFMRRRGEVRYRSSADYISLQVYPHGPDQIPDPEAEFSKWALVEVDGFDDVPHGMTTYTLQPGIYAVFEHNGPASDLSTLMYIFSQWLPESDDYELDDREHFELLPESYDPGSHDAREDFYIPVKSKR